MNSAISPDRLTAACIGVIAACLVTSDHEAFGHGGACLILHGHIVTLTSSIFRCDVRSGWIDVAGPLGNLVAGALAQLLQRLVPPRFAGTRLFLVAVTALSWFWESAYAPYAMLRRSGDLYFFSQFLLGDVTVPVRLAVGAGGVLLYLVTARTTSRALLALWPELRAARDVARMIWLGATAAAALAALTFKGSGTGDLKDAVLEIGAASLALLFIPRAVSAPATEPGTALPRSYAAIAFAVVVFALFAATLGHGIGAA